MKIQASKLALASALSAAALYIGCWTIVAVLPDMATTVTENMLHVHLDDVAWKMTLGSLIVGTVAWALTAGGTVWLVATVYNRISGDGPN